jgi:galactokinase
MDKPTISAAFSACFAAAPALVVRAPGRINLIGEHTDYNGGLVLPAAIDKAIWLAATPRNDGRFVFFAADLAEYFDSDTDGMGLQASKKWANYLLGVISEARRDGLALGGMNLAFGGDIPLGAGLSSSAALESGMAYALDHLNALGLGKMDLVRLAQRGENNFVGMQCGIMDMFASVMGKAGQVLRLDCRDLAFEYFPFQSEDYCLLLLDSGVKHQLVDSEYNTRRSECEAGVEALRRHAPGIGALRDVSLDMLARHAADLPPVVQRRCRYVVEEMARVEAACAALQAGDFEALGGIMYAGHAGLDAQYEVCVAETNFLVEQARRLGAAGARQMGGGFGGCTINLLKKKDLDMVTEKMSAAYKQAFGLGLVAYPVRIADGVEEGGGWKVEGGGWKVEGGTYVLCHFLGCP